MRCAGGLAALASHAVIPSMEVTVALCGGDEPRRVDRLDIAPSEPRRAPLRDPPQSCADVRSTRRLRRCRMACSSRYVGLSNPVSRLRRLVRAISNEQRSQHSRTRSSLGRWRRTFAIQSAPAPIASGSSRPCFVALRQILPFRRFADANFIGFRHMDFPQRRLL